MHSFKRSWPFYLTLVLAITGVLRAGVVSAEAAFPDALLSSGGCRYFGISTEQDALVLIDPGSGAAIPVGSLGFDATTAGADFDSSGTMWAFSADGGNPNQAFLYTLDLTTGAAQIRHVIDISVGGGGVGLEFGPDGQLYWMAGGTQELRRIDTGTGAVTKVMDVPFESVALGLRDGDSEFFTFDFARSVLMRLNPATGAITEVGPTAAGIVSLAPHPDGRLFAMGTGTLYQIDPATGAATVVGPKPGVPGTTFHCPKPPRAEDDIYHAECGLPVVVGAPGILLNDSDPEGSLLTAADPSLPVNGGELTVESDGSFTYLPPPGVCENTFTYVARDADGLDSNRATVRIVPPADCLELYGVSTAESRLVRIDPFTGAVTPVGDGLGIPVATAGLDFDSSGKLWAFSQNQDDANEAFLYTVDLVTGKATVIHRIDVSELGGGVGLEFGPDGHLYRVAGDGRQLLRIDVQTGEVTKVADLPFSSVSLTLPERCVEFFSADQEGNLMRIDPVDGSVSFAAPTVAGLYSLASAPGGALYGLGNNILYRIDPTTGEAIEVGPSPGIPGSAFRPKFEKSFCLDSRLRFERGKPLSRYVVSVNALVDHVNECPREPEVCEICRPNRPECGTCGAPGFYRLPRGAELTFKTPAVPTEGVYELKLQIRGFFGVENAKLRISIGSGASRQVFEVMPDNTSWDYTEPILVNLAAGENHITVRSIGQKPVDLERVSLERRCPGSCPIPKQNECLDRKFDPSSGLSKWVTAIEGDAGHAPNGGCCGSEGYYWVRGSTGRIELELPVQNSGRHLVKIFYRVKSEQDDVSVRVGIPGGDSRVYTNAELVHGNHFQWSLPFELDLSAGQVKFEIASMGKDRIDVERISIQRVCECGGGSEE